MGDRQALVTGTPVLGTTGCGAGATGRAPARLEFARFGSCDAEESQGPEVVSGVVA
jgi:hypothetical protein